MMEKLVILTHIYDREFQSQLNHGHAQELLTHMFQGRYASHAPMATSIFQQVNQPYREVLQSTFAESTEKLKDTAAEGRLYIEPYEATEKRFERKMKRSYRFVANPMREQLTTLMNARLLFA
jgi:hypothetical protein